MERWWRLEGQAPQDLEESLLWLFSERGISRVAFEARPEAPDPVRLRAWLPEAAWPGARRRELELALAALVAPSGGTPATPEWTLVEEEDWGRRWKEHWRPDPVGARLLILPAWLRPPPGAGERLVIRMDPGSAFGTGGHPTTRLCLECLERLDLRGARVVDIGCGSGILSLAALRLGAGAVLACDTDPPAVRATRANAALNGVVCDSEDDDGHGDGPVPSAATLRVVSGSVPALRALQQRHWGERRADVLLCNILAPVIHDLLPAFADLMRAGGVGLLSGLLVSQEEDLVAALAARGWCTRRRVHQQPWSLLEVRRAGTLPLA
jgi:ribosomal protein L11 methyltransferase